MTWRTLHVASGVTNVTLFSVVVTPQGHIWAAGFGTGANGNLEGVVVHYNGVTWQNHYTGDNHILNRVSASTARHAWAVGASRTILYTDTSGQTWTRQAIPANVPAGNFMDVLAISETEAWVVGDDGVILRTTNSGQTWVLQPESDHSRPVVHLDDRTKRHLGCGRVRYDLPLRWPELDERHRRDR